MLKPEKYNKKPSNTAKFHTASSAVYSVLDDLQYGEERFSQFLKWAFDAINELSFDVLYEVHVEEIEMKPWKQICFPENMVMWTKIGFRCGDTIKVFTMDKSIPKLHDKVDCVPQENTPCVDISLVEPLDTIVPFYSLSFFNGSDHYYGSLCDYNYHGYFDVDWKNRVFNFKRTVAQANMVYLEYISDGINPTGATVIHPFAFKAVQLYIHWWRKESDDRFGQSECDRAKKLYEEEVDKILVRNMNLSIEDIKEALRSGYRQTIKN